MSRVVVIGAGVIGLMCGYELTKSGANVTVLDQGEPGRACSLGNAGWIVPSLSSPLPAPGLTGTALMWTLHRDSPLYIDPKGVPILSSWLWNFWRRCNARDYHKGLEAFANLNRLTMPLYDALEKEGLDFQMERSGLLFLFLSQSSMKAELQHIASLADHGIHPPQPLSGEEVRKMEPAVSSEVTAGFWVREDRHVDPELLTASLSKWLTQHGAEVHSGMQIQRGEYDGKKLRGITTSQGNVRGDHFLLAAGSWSGLVAKKLGFYLPIQAGKGYSITIRDSHPKIGRPLYLGEARVGCTPFKNALRLAGTMELSGINLDLHRERVLAIGRAAARYLSHCPPIEEQSGWVGMRPLLPDGLPAIGRAPGFDNVFVATGHGSLGITLAPATANVIGQLICTGQTDVDLAPFDPGRFS